MPKVTNSAIWAVSLRKSVSKLSKGWTVEEARGNVRLVIRIPEQPKQSVVLPFSWSELQADDSYIRIRNIYLLIMRTEHFFIHASQRAVGLKRLSFLCVSHDVNCSLVCNCPQPAHFHPMQALQAPSFADDAAPHFV